MTGKYIEKFHGILKKVHLILPMVAMQFAKIIGENGNFL